MLTRKIDKQRHILYAHKQYVFYLSVPSRMYHLLHRDPYLIINYTQWMLYIANYFSFINSDNDHGCNDAVMFAFIRRWKR